MHCKLYLVCLVIGLVGFGGTLCSNAEEVQDESSNLQSLRDQIFAGKVASLEPTNTFKNLERLAELESANNNGFVSEEVQNLIDVGRFDDTKCNPASFKKIDSLETYDLVKASIIKPYLAYCAQKQFLHCKERFGSALKDAVELLADQDKDDLRLLDEIYIKPKRSTALARIKFPVIPMNLGQALSQFINGRRVSTSDKYVKPNEKPINTVKRKIGLIQSICERVTGAVKTVTSGYEAVGNRANVVEQFDQFAVDWVPRLKFCDSALRCTSLKKFYDTFVQDALKEYQ